MAKKTKTENGEGEERKICGAVKTDGSGKVCQLQAGYGTDHLGWGKCKWHFGNTRALKTAAAREEAEEIIKTFAAGVRVDAEPDVLMLQEIQRTAAIVEWFEKLIGEMGINELVHLTDIGARPRAFVDIYQRERAHLINSCKIAISLGLAERQVKLAEEQGALLATCIKLILGDLNLTAEQRALAPQIVARHLKSVA